MAIEFVKMMISEEGQNIFTDIGQPPIVPAVVDDIDLLPEELKPFVVVE